MVTEHSSVGTHLAELYNSIHEKQQGVEAAKAKVKEAEGELDKVKNTFADYLKSAGIDKLLAPAQAELFADAGGDTGNGAQKERKPRTSSADRQAEVERNKAIYTSEYPLGLDEKTGLPKRYKGRGSANDTINAQMADDLRDYEAKQSGNSEPAAEAAPAAPKKPAAAKK